MRRFVVSTALGVAVVLCVTGPALAASPPINPAIAVYVEQIPSASGSQTGATPGHRASKPSKRIQQLAGTDAGALAALSSSVPLASASTQSSGRVTTASQVFGSGAARPIAVIVLLVVGTVAALAVGRRKSSSS